jgi:hypothetical protein
MAMRAKIVKMQKNGSDKAAHGVKKGDKSDINYINPPSTIYISNLGLLGRGHIDPPIKVTK